jgi:ribonuclease P protein component
MQTFKKNERLSGQKIIELLFSEGRSFAVFPFRMVWMENKLDETSPAKVLITVSKKKFKRAVDRNLIKRRIREAYRRHKTDFYNFLDDKKIHCDIVLLYNADTILTFKELEEKIILLLHRFQTEYEKVSR